MGRGDDREPAGPEDPLPGVAEAIEREGYPR